MTISATRDVVRQPSWWPYGWWAGVGALLCFGFLAGFTIGPPFLVLGLALGGAGLAIPATRSPSVTALPAGLALPLLYVAWLNRDGPGTICTTTATGGSCEEQWNPWPWVGAAVVLVLATIVLTVATRALTRTRRG